mmetsp:Transcript_91376/g.295505  ORF Transcript_91376/g.295505 Transcript_91376/m.295505 type:complete len:207 (-) Transcript_91376:379-999(-)
MTSRRCDSMVWRPSSLSAQAPRRRKLSEPFAMHASMEWAAPLASGMSPRWHGCCGLRRPVEPTVLGSWCRCWTCPGGWRPQKRLGGPKQARTRPWSCSWMPPFHLASAPTLVVLRHHPRPIACWRYNAWRTALRSLCLERHCCPLLARHCAPKLGLHCGLPIGRPRTPARAPKLRPPPCCSTPPWRCARRAGEPSTRGCWPLGWTR